MDVDKKKNCKQIAAAAWRGIVLTCHEDLMSCQKQVLLIPSQQIQKIILGVSTPIVQIIL